MRSVNRAVGFGMGLAMLLNGFSAIAAPLPPAHTLAQLETPPPMPADLPGLVARRIKLDLAKRINVPASKLNIYHTSAASWSDDCLELAASDEACQAKSVQGWEVLIREENTSNRWKYRSDRIGRRLRLDFNAGAEHNNFSAELSQQLLLAASEQLQRPVSHLSLGNIQAVTWDDGCLGMTDADTACTQATMPGFRAVVRYGYQDWVYHLSADGSQIMQNTAASDTKGKVSVFFMDARRTTEAANEAIDLASPPIFQGQYRSWLEGTITTTAVNADGEVTITIMDLGSDSDVPKWETQYQAPPEDVAALQRLLEQNNFSSFDQMSYHTDESVAFEGEYIVTGAGANVMLSHWEPHELPAKLQPIIEAWEKIAI